MQDAKAHLMEIWYKFIACSS